MNGWLLVVALYAGGYQQLLQPQTHYGIGGLGRQTYDRVAADRAGGTPARLVFAPPGRLDRLARPAYWGGWSCADTSDLDLGPTGGVREKAVTAARRLKGRALVVLFVRPSMSHEQVNRILAAGDFGGG